MGLAEVFLALNTESHRHLLIKNYITTILFARNKVNIAGDMFSFYAFSHSV